MDDPSNPEEAGPTRASVSGFDLDQLLASHRRWVESVGQEGTLADLRGMDFSRAELTGVMLRGANLADARFRKAILTGADLAGADLTGADFHGADLSRADLRGAKLRDTNFHDAGLASADLTDSVGLLGAQLCGTDLAGAKIPETAGKWESLANIAEASKMTQSLFATVLLVCSYIWLTVASTTDSQLLNNAAPPASRLPILGTDIPLVRFYLVAPLLLLCLYVYFHLCLQRLWEELAELPAVFPDGRPLDKKAYPWLMNVLIRAHLPHLRAHRSNLARWQSRMSIVLGWGLVPITIMTLWFRYIRSHDWNVTLVHVLLIGAAIGAGTGFLGLASATLTGAEKKTFLWRKAWANARTRCFLASTVGLIVFFVFSYGVIEGVDPNLSEQELAIFGAGRMNVRRVIPKVFEAIGYPAFAHLDDANLSTKPANWTGKSLQEIDSVKAADLTSRNLRFASAFNAFLAGAYMMDIDARGIDFRESDLRRADFRRSDLRTAHFRKANMEKADLRWTDLSHASLREANLKDADLTEAKLTDAQLRDAKAAGAIFKGADLRGTNLTGTDLSGADLSEVVGLTQTQLDLATVDSGTKLPAGFKATVKMAARPVIGQKAE